MSSAPWPVAGAAFHTGPALTHRQVPGLTAPDRTRQAPVWRQPIAPAPGMGAPSPHWWWLGAHGGAGVSTLTALAAVSGDSRRAWPSGAPQQSPNVVIVCRTHTDGLERARDLLRQHTVGGLLPPTLRVLGLVTVPDAPGRAPTELRKLMKLVAAAAPTAWHLPWIEAWRSAHLHELPTWHPNGTPPAPVARREVVPSVPPDHLRCFTELYDQVQQRHHGPAGQPS